jgi:hypothetical protein
MTLLSPIFPTKERFKVPVQHGFEFTHERPPINLLFLLIHTVLQAFVPNSASMLLSLANLLTIRVFTRILSLESEFLLAYVV